MLAGGGSGWRAQHKKSQAGSAAGKSAQRARAKGRWGARGRGRRIVDEALWVSLCAEGVVSRRVQRREKCDVLLQRFGVEVEVGENARGASYT